MLEYVPDPTLAQRIASGPLPLEEVDAIVRQLIDALEDAHERGIMHRDLKPANVKITPDGKVKVLDFGLAKALVGEPLDEVASNSPTLAATALTRGAMLLGTAAYMSPEQARGKAVDKRSDIFAFGSVLYEMLTGKQAFGGETISDSPASILRNEPDRSLLPAETSLHVRRLLDRCLEKDPKRRLRDIGEARIIVDATEGAPRPLTPGSQPRARMRAVPWAVAALAVLAGSAGWWLWLRAPKPVQRPVTRLATPLPNLSQYVWPAISRDGTRLAFVAGSARRIHLRMMDQFEAKPIAGTDNGTLPFFSPDGQWIGFHQDGKLKKVQIVGGATMTLCDAGPNPNGASWGLDGNIVFGGATGGRELFYRNGDKVMVAEIEPGPSFRSRTPQVLFEGRYVGAFGSYDVTADGKRFLMVKPGGESETGGGQVHVVLEWFEEIRRRVRAGG